LLKAYQYIPSDIDVPKSFLSYLNEPPPPFESLSSNDDWNNRSFVDVQLAVLRHYLQWRLEMQPHELDSIIKTYCRLKHRSFRLIEKSLKILEEEVGFSKEKVSSSNITVVIIIIIIAAATTTTTTTGAVIIAVAVRFASIIRKIRYNIVFSGAQPCQLV
jgi:hypothetical protein